MQSVSRWKSVAIFAALLVSPACVPMVVPAQMASAPVAPVLGQGVLPAAQVEHLLPPAVYFQGQSAPLQLRNAAVYHAANGGIFWASLVDTSGYSTGVRERYQFYLVTERPLRFGKATLAAGAYGAGFLSDGNAVLLDLGGREIARTPVTNDAAFKRPRPLQLVEENGRLRLYLGRQYVEVTLP